MELLEGEAAKIISVPPISFGEEETTGLTYDAVEILIFESELGIFHIQSLIMWVPVMKQQLLVRGVFMLLIKL